MDEQMQVYNKFISEMAADVKRLEEPPNYDGKLQDLTKFKKDTKRKQDQLEKREQHSWEEALSNAGENDGGINKLIEKIGKTINDTIKKAKNKAVQSQDVKQKS